MSPSLFDNEYSRGPLYQYWKERGAEEQALRAHRVQEARLRSKGMQPATPTFGPSSNDQYASRATSGPPAYAYQAPESAVESSSSAAAAAATPATQAQASPTGPDPEPLPTYDTVTQQSQSQHPQHSSTIPTMTTTTTITSNSNLPSQSTAVPLSAEEEKTRLQQLEPQRRQIADDAAIAQILNNEDEDEEDSDDQNPDEREVNGTNKAKQKRPEKRRKSTAGKIGRWLADAASGYTKKQERW